MAKTPSLVDLCFGVLPKSHSLWPSESQDDFDVDYDCSGGGRKCVSELVKISSDEEPTKGSMHHYYRLRGHCQDFGYYASGNRGRIQAAEFLEELISRASELVDVNAGHNLIPPESVDVICSALEIANGKLQRIDLTGNHKLCQADHVSAFSEFQHNGEPAALISSSSLKYTL